MFEKIKRIQSLAKKNFEENYLYKKSPVIISSGLNWKAFSWTPDYFKKAFPDKIVALELNHIIQVGRNTIRTSTIEKMSMNDAIELISTNKNPNTKYYLSQKPLYKEFPELIFDIGKPIWRDENLEYEESAINLWYGEAYNATPLHFDVSHNFLVQIYGRKWIRLFAPKDTKHLYPHTHETKGPRHLSQILDIDNVDTDLYPLFKNAVSYEANLLPGETLFIPSGWWHDVRSLDEAISVNFWWSPKIHECTLSQVLPMHPYGIFEIGRLQDMYNFLPELRNFKSDIEVAHFFIKDEQYTWFAILFMANFIVNKLKSIAVLLNIPVPERNFLHEIQLLNYKIHLIDKSLAAPEKDFLFWLALIEKSGSENNDLLEKRDLLAMLDEIQIFSKSINHRLVNDNTKQFSN